MSSFQLPNVQRPRKSPATLVLGGMADLAKQRRGARHKRDTMIALSDYREDIKIMREGMQSASDSKEAEQIWNEGEAVALDKAKEALADFPEHEEDFALLLKGISVDSREKYLDPYISLVEKSETKATISEVSNRNTNDFFEGLNGRVLTSADLERRYKQHSDLVDSFVKGGTFTGAEGNDSKNSFKQKLPEEYGHFLVREDPSKLIDLIEGNSEIFSSLTEDEKRQFTRLARVEADHQEREQNAEMRDRQDQVYNTLFNTIKWYGRYDEDGKRLWEGDLPTEQHIKEIEDEGKISSGHAYSLLQYIDTIRKQDNERQTNRALVNFVLDGLVPPNTSNSEYVKGVNEWYKDASTDRSSSIYKALKEGDFVSLDETFSRLGVIPDLFKSNLLSSIDNFESVSLTPGKAGAEPIKRPGDKGEFPAVADLNQRTDYAIKSYEFLSSLRNKNRKLFNDTFGSTIQAKVEDFSNQLPSTVLSGSTEGLRTVMANIARQHTPGNAGDAEIKNWLGETYREGGKTVSSYSKMHEYIKDKYDNAVVSPFVLQIANSIFENEVYSSMDISPEGITGIHKRTMAKLNIAVGEDPLNPGRIVALPINKLLPSDCVDVLITDLVIRAEHSPDEDFKRRVKYLSEKIYPRGKRELDFAESFLSGLSPVVPFNTIKWYGRWRYRDSLGIPYPDEDIRIVMIPMPVHLENFMKSNSGTSTLNPTYLVSIKEGENTYPVMDPNTGLPLQWFYENPARHEELIKQGTEQKEDNKKLLKKLQDENTLRGTRALQPLQGRPMTGRELGR